MELWTERGLKLFLITQAVAVLSAIVGLISVASVLVGLVALDDVGGAGLGALGAGLGILCLIGMTSCLLALTLLVLYIISMVYMWKGKDEFGKEHSSKVGTGIVLIIVGVVVSFVPILGTFGGIVTAVGYIFLVMAIIQDRYKTLLWAYIGLVVVGTMVNLGGAVLGLFGPSLLVSGIQGVGGIFGIIALALLLFTYYQTWRGIKDGEIRPVPRSIPDIDVSAYDRDIYK